MDETTPPAGFTYLRAAVFGGGGVSGLAWQTGLVWGLAQGGIHLRHADCFIGTSAGAVVAAQLAGTAPLEGLWAAQTAPAAQSAEQARPYSQAAVDRHSQQLLAKHGGNLLAARQRIGRFAMQSRTTAPELRRAVIAARLPLADWPVKPLRLVTVVAVSGTPCVLDAASGATLVDAVAASCAVPGAWPAVDINGVHYIDGGVASLTHAHLAHDSARVLVVSPLGFGDDNPLSGHLRQELQHLALQGCHAQVLVPDAPSRRAMGDNLLDPVHREQSAYAGLNQGLAAAAALAKFWV